MMHKLNEMSFNIFDATYHINKASSFQQRQKKASIHICFLLTLAMYSCMGIVAAYKNISDKNIRK